MMNIILNEKDYAENAIRHHDLGEDPMETLKCVSRFYSANGYNKKDIKSHLNEFLLRCDSDVDLFLWEDTVDYYSKTAKKHELVELFCIPITKKELDVCTSLEKKYLQRLMFTLICLAKYNYLSNKNHNGWVNTKHSDIFKMANIITSSTDQDRLLRALRDLELIRFSNKVTSLSLAVECMDLDGDVELEVTDFRNLGNQLRGYMGEPIVECEECGLTIMRRGNHHKYCRACSIEVNRRNALKTYFN